MTHEEYQDLFAQMLHMDKDFSPVIVPIEPLDNEEPMETFLRYLVEENLIELQDNMFRIPSRAKVAERDPNLLKMLDSIWQAGLLAELDYMEQMGMAFLTADDSGNIFYMLTDSGRAAMQ